MEGFARFWNANAMLIGIVCSVLAIAAAAALRDGQLATVFGLIAGIAFMWLGRPVHHEDGSGA